MLGISALHGFNAAGRLLVPTTLNPSDKAGSIALSNGNLTATDPVNENAGVRAILSRSSGKHFFTWNMVAGTNFFVGVAKSGYTLTTDLAGGGDANIWTLNMVVGNKIHGGSNTGYGSALTPGDVGMCAVDLDGAKIWWGENGTWFNSGDPAAGTNAAWTDVVGPVFPIWSTGGDTSAIGTLNFGATALPYSPPSGFNPGWYTEG
jgi:hypothetical protein